MNKKTLILGNDHTGFRLKQYILNYFEVYNICNVIDLGCNTETMHVDYPDYAKLVAEKLIQIPNSIGILICSTGIGMSIAANNIKYIRCALCNDVESAIISRRQFNANVLALGQKKVTHSVAVKIIQEFCIQEFQKGINKTRLNKVKQLRKLFN